MPTAPSAASLPAPARATRGNPPLARAAAAGPVRAAVVRPRTTSPWAERRHSAIHGWGMFATRAVPAGTRIIEYVGVKLTKAQSWRIEEARVARREQGGAGHVWIFDLNQREDLDGDYPWNTARHINHSCAPNCEAQQIRGRVWIVARRDLAPGEELTFDYGFPYDTWREHPCRCGTPACVGFIVNKAQRWRVRRILAAERRAAAAEARQAARAEAKTKSQPTARAGDSASVGVEAAGRRRAPAAAGGPAS